MELHTLGVDGGYTQRDVTELARMLTGWTMAPRQPKRRRVMMDSNPGQGDSVFLFDPARHDDSPKNGIIKTQRTPLTLRMENSIVKMVLLLNSATVIKMVD